MQNSTTLDDRFARELVLTDVTSARAERLERAAAVLGIALIACLAVWHGWRAGYVLAPTDALKLVAPWQGGDHDYVARNEQLLDQTVQFVPWSIYTVERYKLGQIPLWNPNSQLGVPFIGNGQSAAFYPTTFLHWVLKPEWSWTVSAALRLFMAGLGVYLLAGRYGLRGWARFLSAVAFMLCGFNVVWLNHPHMNVMPLLPWAVLVTEMLVERVTLWRMAGGAVVFAVQFLGGHPATCIHLLLTCCVVWVFRAVGAFRNGPQAGRLNRGRVVASGLALGGAVTFGFALAAAQWLPLIEYANHSGAALERNAKLAGQGWWAFEPRHLIGLVFPYANGYPDGVTPFQIRDVTKLPNTSELAAGFVGTVPFVLALFAAIALRRAPVVRLWTVVAVVAAVIAVRFPIVDNVVRRVPGLGVAQNARLFGVVALALALLAGFGLDGLVAAVRGGVELKRLRTALRRAAIGIAALALLMAAALWIGKARIISYGQAKAEAAYDQSSDHEHSKESVKALVPRIHTEMLLTSARLLIPAAMLGAMLLIVRQGRTGTNRATGHGPQASRLKGGRWPVFLPAGLLGLALVDLLAFAIPFNPGAPAATYFPADVPVINRLRELPPYRFAATHRTMAPETSTAYGLADLRGYDALAPERYYKWWKHPGIGNLPGTLQGYPARMDNPEHPAWSLLNLGFVLTGPDHEAPPAEDFDPLESEADAHVFQAKKIRPRAWVVPRADAYDDVRPVLDRVAKMDFDPAGVVLLDKDVYADPQAPVREADKVWTNAATATGPASRKVAVEFLPPPKGEDDRPEVVRLRVTGASGGYLVLADTYFPGWTATVINEGQNTGKEVPILPAYGVLRAVPLPNSATAAAAPTLRVEFRYRPWSWRIGALVSMTAACLLALLVGAAMFTLGRQEAGAAA